MTDFPLLADHWFVACLASQLGSRPLARTILDQPVVLFRAGGKPAALLDRCPHRNAPLSAGRVVGERLACPYHGWQFDGAGRCRGVPGLCGEPPERATRATAFPVVEQDGLIWLYARAGAEPATPPPRFPPLGERGYRHFIGTGRMEGSLPNVLENFLDGTHTHFVHGGLIRTEGARKEVRALVRRLPAGVEAEYRDEGVPSGLISRLFGAGIDLTIGRFLLPSLAQLEYRSEGRVRLMITLCFTPTGDDECALFAVVVGAPPRGLGWLAVPLLKGLFWQALRQDQGIVAQQRATIRRFGGEQFASTELDLLRPHILRLLKHGPFPAGEPLTEREILLRL